MIAVLFRAGLLVAAAIGYAYAVTAIGWPAFVGLVVAVVAGALLAWDIVTADEPEGRP